MIESGRISADPDNVEIMLGSDECGCSSAESNVVLSQCSDSMDVASVEEFWKRPRSPVFMDDDSCDSGYGSSQIKDAHEEKENERVECSRARVRSPTRQACDDSPFTAIKAPHKIQYQAAARLGYTSSVCERIAIKSLKVPSPQFSRCLSESEVGEVAILRAIQNAEENKSLIGDFSGSHALPLLKNPRIHDLRCVGTQTVCDILDNRFADIVDNFVLIDCRYPYEFVGGHIKSAINIYTQNQLKDFLDNDQRFRQFSMTENNYTTKRNVLLFYCEFSKERGPRMCRFLRAYDRRRNEYRYPYLDYPEIYLIDGGYKNFFAERKEYCEPQCYKPMDHADHSEDLRKFRIKSKSWSTFGTAGTQTSSCLNSGVAAEFGKAIGFNRNFQNTDSHTPQKPSVLRRGLFKQHN